MLFEVALLLKPTTKEAEDGQIEKLIVKPTPVVAKSPEAAGAKVLKANLTNIEAEDLDRIEVMSRPFV